MYTYNANNVQFLDTEGALTEHKVNARCWYETEAWFNYTLDGRTKFKVMRLSQWLGLTAVEGWGLEGGSPCADPSLPGLPNAVF